MAHHVIVGLGLAGRTAARWLLTHTTGDELTIVGGEPEPFYPRHNLHHLIAGDISEPELLDPRWFGNLERLTVRSGTRVTAITPAHRRVKLNDGRTLAYDTLLLATGSVANPPPWPNSDLDGVFTLRTLADARGILAKARNTRRALIAGGGVLGIDTLYGLHRRGVPTTLLVRDAFPGKPALDETGGAIIRRRLERLGLDVRYGADVAAVQVRDGRLTGVSLASGGRMDADLLIATVGSRADLRFLQGSGVATNRGVLVDECMETSVPRIFAAGDVAEALSQPHGRRLTGAAWRTAVHQARIAAMMMAGQTPDVRPRAFAITQGVYDLHYTAIGDVGRSGDNVQVVTRLDIGREVYRKIVLADGVIVGALLLGDLDDLDVFERLISDGAALTRDEAERLLHSGREADVPKIDFSKVVAGNGKNGQPVLVTAEGRVYDLTASGLWQLGIHVARHVAGRDLTAALRDAPHDASVLSRYPMVGKTARRPVWLPTLASLVLAAALVLLAVSAWFFWQLGLPH